MLLNSLVTIGLTPLYADSVNNKILSQTKLS
jgi:hypothetical protein